MKIFPASVYPTARESQVIYTIIRIAGQQAT